MASNLDIGVHQTGVLDIGVNQTSSATPINTTINDNQAGNWGDSIASQLFDAATLNVQISGDQFNFLDAVSINMFVSDVALIDTISFSDQLLLNVLPIPVNVTLSDTLSLSDNVQFALGLLNIELEDVWVLNDSTTLLANNGGQFNDQFPFADNLQIELDGSGVTLADTFSFTDTLLVKVTTTLVIQLADTFAFSDSITTPLMSDTFNAYIRQYLNDVIN